tara:strand:- start:109 stop:846 length:738 start_codon:yes stop_codon:yes gene_type:complete
VSTTSSSDDDDDDTQESKKKKKKKNIAVFISGGGSNMKAIHAACESGQINGRISVVITSSSTAGGVEWAMGRDVPVLLYPGAKDVPESERISPAELDEYLKNDYKIDVVVLAGYLRLIPPKLCRTFENKMVNIHPALLPAFGGKGMHGAKVHEAVVKSGARFTGPTVHFVNENFDEGKIVAQRSIRIDPSWTADEVQRRVLKEEHDVFPEVVAALCDDRIEFREEDGVGVIVDARLGSDGKRRCY